MADAKPQRCRLTTQQKHTQQPVPTPPRLKSVTIHDAPSCYTESRIITEPRVTSPEAEYYTEAPKYYITKAPEYYTSMYAAPAYYDTEALKYYTTTYVAPSFYTYVPKNYCT
jgi:hypothetical protein